MSVQDVQLVAVDRGFSKALIMALSLHPGTILFARGGA